jgi:hypothetical protein
MLLAFALGAALAGALQDSVVVRALLSSERIPSGTSTVLVISVETNGATPSEIPVPVLPAGLELGPVSDFSQLQVAFPGGRRRTTRREIVVLARAPGRYRIPAVELEVAGRRHATRALDLTVVASGTAIPGASPGEGTVELRAWIVPDTVYAGQQLLYRAEAAFPESLRLRQTRAPVFDPPATTGFWVYDVPDPVTVGLRVVGNETLEVQSFRQVLFPLHPGDFQIPPAGMRYEFRAGSIFSPETRQLTATPIAVHVRPLPPGRPAVFQGAVGEYTLQVSLAADRAHVGDAVTLRATLEGTGNIKALPRPELPPLAGVDVHTGPEQVEVGFSDDRVTGRKTFEWLLMPRAPGRLEVPGIRYAWFDPARERFHQVSTAPLALTVEPALTADREPGELAPLRRGVHAAPLAFVREPWFLALQALPLLLLLLALRRGRGARRAIAGARGTPAGEELRALSRVEDPRLCLERLGTLLQREIGRASGTEERSLRALHERVRQARYAPEPPDAQTRDRLLAEARALLAAEPGRGTRPLLILWLLLWAGPTQAQQHEPGLRAFRPVEADRAVQVFTSAVDARPDDATAWYHLGHAFAAREQRGRAAWAWLRALQREPRAADARQNLHAIGAQPALDALGPRVPLSSDELALVAATAWWAAALALLVSLRGRRRRPLQLASGTLALLALLCVAVVAARARPATRAVTLERLVLRAAPALRADSVASLAPATPLRLRDVRGDWARVVDPEQREGWLERALIGRL